MSRLVAFWSPTGAGATTLLLNVASALSAQRVVLVAADFNLTAPSLALYADLLPHDAPAEACLSKLLPALSGERLTADEISRRLLPGPGFSALPGMLDVVGASRLTEGHMRQLLRALSTRFDLVLADLTPAMDSIGCLPVLEQADLICLVAGPEIASRFHTRRFVQPLMGMGWEEKTALVINRAGGINPTEAEHDIGLPVAATVPDLKLMPDLIEAGRIAYEARTVLPALGKFRNAVERLGALVLKKGGVAGAQH